MVCNYESKKSKLWSLEHAIVDCPMEGQKFWVSSHRRRVKDHSTLYFFHSTLFTDWNFFLPDLVLILTALTLFQWRIKKCRRPQTPRRSFYWKPAATETCQTLQQKSQNQFLPRTPQTERTWVFMATFIRKHPWLQTEGREAAQFWRTGPGKEALNMFIFLLSEVFVIGDRSVNRLTKASKQWWKVIFPDTN